MSKLDHMLEPGTSVRRVEVITETGRRRQFSADDKARFVEETLVPGAVVSEVAGGMDCRRNSCLRGAGRCDSRLRSLRLLSRRRSCLLSLPHRPGRRSAHCGSTDAGARGRREQRHHRDRD